MMGNPEKNKNRSKLTEVVQEFIQVQQSRLHLLLHPLSFVAIAVHQVNGIQTFFASLQFHVHLQDQIHAFIHLLSHFLFLMLHAFMLYAGPLVFQPLQILIHILHNHFIASCSRHLDSAQTSNKLRVKHDPPCSSLM